MAAQAKNLGYTFQVRQVSAGGQNVVVRGQLLEHARAIRNTHYSPVEAVRIFILSVELERTFDHRDRIRREALI